MLSPSFSVRASAKFKISFTERLFLGSSDFVPALAELADDRTSPSRILDVMLVWPSLTVI